MKNITFNSNCIINKAFKVDDIKTKKIVIGEPMNQKAAEEFVRIHIQTMNIIDGRIAEIPVNTIGKIIRHKGYNMTRIIESMQTLYETSIWGWSEAEIVKAGHKKHGNIKAYHHYINKFTDGTGEYYIRFVIVEPNVKQGKQGKNYIHSASISESAVYKNGESFDRIRLRRPGVKNSSPFIDLRLKDFLNFVNQNNL